jgi:hypothetical protein
MDLKSFAEAFIDNKPNCLEQGNNLSAVFATFNVTFWQKSRPALAPTI